MLIMFVHDESEVQTWGPAAKHMVRCGEQIGAEAWTARGRELTGQEQQQRPSCDQITW